MLVVLTVNCFLSHAEYAHGIRDGLCIPVDIFVLCVVEICHLVEVLELLDDPFEYLSSFFSSTAGTEVGSSVELFLVISIFEIGIAENVDPLFAVVSIALNPLSSHFLHAHYAVFIIFEVFVAFQTEYIFLFHYVFLIF